MRYQSKVSDAKRAQLRAASRRYYQRHGNSRRNKELTANSHKKYYESNKHKWREYVRTQQRKPEGRILNALRCRIYNAIKLGVKSDRTVKLLGCSVRSFMIYLESRFKVGMSWQNYGEKCHIDHIVPCSMFDLSRHEHQESCFHFSNMRPMWATHNLRRGKRGHHQLNMVF